MPDPKKIPRDALREGIDLCLKVAGWRLREACVLLDAAPQTAAILFSFGVEEFGKAALLYEALQPGDDPVVIKGFYSHTAKFTAAGRYIGRSDWLLSQGGFHADAFDLSAFDAGQPADADARFASLYVEWDGGWRQGTNDIDKETLSRSIDSVSNVIASKRAAWGS